jgi:plasmid stabilization system protein ParE
MPRRFRILWTGPALDDLRAVREHVSRDRPEAAKRLAGRIRDRVALLAVHPESGRVVPELEPLGYREVIAAPYRIVYELRKRDVVVLRVWHGRREMERADPVDAD